MTLFNSDILLLFVIIFFVVIISVVLFLILKLIKLTRQQNESNSDSIRQPIVKPTDEKQKHLFPLKLQAYERIVLFLERIEPSSLLLRSKLSDMTANLLHSTLLNNIREEYEHNVAQQIYVSDNAWNLTKQAKEETIRIVNLAAESMEKDSSANDLTRNVFEKMMVLPKSPSQIALEYIKQEVKELI